MILRTYRLKISPYIKTVFLSGLNSNASHEQNVKLGQYSTISSKNHAVMTLAKLVHN